LTEGAVWPYSHPLAVTIYHQSQPACPPGVGNAEGACEGESDGTLVGKETGSEVGSLVG
jgi:hypothetical protein